MRVTEVGALVRRYQGTGYAVALSFLHGPDDAKDVLQDAFITTFCRLGQLREPADRPAPVRARLAGQRAWAAVREMPEPQRCVVLPTNACHGT